MKRHGFTLLELLMVVAVMGLLGTVATAGYYAAVSNMEMRGAKESVASLIKAAEQRAETDHVPTVVYFYNQLLREGSVSHNAVAVGVAVAVRAGGRVSCVVKGRGRMSGTFLVDEFNDIEHGRPSYGGSDKEEHLSYLESRSAGTRLYRIDMSRPEIDFSEVCDYVVERSKFGECREALPTAGLEDVEVGSSAYAFRITDGSKGKADSKWNAGDLYGYEIAVLQLPHNIIFGNGSGDIPTLNDPIKDEVVKTIFFKANGDRRSGSTTVKMSTCRTTSDTGALAIDDTFDSQDLSEKK